MVTNTIRYNQSAQQRPRAHREVPKLANKHFPDTQQDLMNIKYSKGHVVQNCLCWNRP